MLGEADFWIVIDGVGRGEQHQHERVPTLSRVCAWPFDCAAGAVLDALCSRTVLTLLHYHCLAPVDREVANFCRQVEGSVDVESVGMLRRARKETDKLLQDRLRQGDAEYFGGAKLKLAFAFARAQDASRVHRHLAGNVAERVHEAAGASMTLEFVDVDEDAARQLTVTDDTDLWICQTTWNFVFYVEGQIGIDFKLRHRRSLRPRRVGRSIFVDLVDFSFQVVALLSGELKRSTP